MTLSFVLFTKTSSATCIYHYFGTGVYSGHFVMSIIVNRGEWLGSSANIKGENKDGKI